MTILASSIILLAHGSRDAQWRTPIEAVASKIIERQPGILLRCAYLELSSPTLPEAAADLIACGARHMRIFPLFLGVGKHAREDMPKLVAQIRAMHPDIQVELLPAAGEFPQLIELLADIALS